jgi:hypothetical protein
MVQDHHAALLAGTDRLALNEPEFDHFMGTIKPD